MEGPVVTSQTAYADSIHVTEDCGVDSIHFTEEQVRWWRSLVKIAQGPHIVVRSILSPEDRAKHD